MNRYVLILACACLLGGTSPGCDRKGSPSGGVAPGGESAARPVIVASIFPLQSLLSQLTGDWADVESMMPPGASPHDFEPVASQMAPLSRADMLIVVGLNLDEWAERAAARIGPPGLAIERMADLVGGAAAATTGQAQSSDASPHGPPNQHLWMDPALTVRFLEALTPILKKKYPAHADEIERRKQALIVDLRQMDDQFRHDLAVVPEKRMISYHNAYDLLAGRYGLTVVAHLTDIELSPGGEVTPRDLVETLEAIKRYHLKAIYAEPLFPGRAVEMIHEQAGVKIIPLDDLGGPGRAGYETYQAMLRSDVNALVQGQSLTTK